MSPAPTYTIAGRELVAQAPGLRVQVLRLTSEQCVPWHSHSEICDTFFCLEGPMEVHLQKPSKVHRLLVGERLDVLPGRPHMVCPGGNHASRFVIVQGVGTYDYLPENPPPGA